MTEKRYLGDGAYVEFDGYALVLTTSDGIRVTNRIVLEFDVCEALIRFLDDLKAAAKSANEHPHAQDGDENRS